MGIGKRLKKEEEPPVIEEQAPVWQDRIFWVSTLQKIAYPVINNLAKGSLRKNMPFESKSGEGQKFVYLEAFARVFNGIWSNAPTSSFMHFLIASVSYALSARM